MPESFDPNLADLAAPMGDWVEFPRRQAIFTEGEPADNLYFIQAGKVKLSQTMPSGREAVLGVLGPSDLLGMLSIFDADVRGATATTLTRVEALAVTVPDVRRWIIRRPEVAEHMLRALVGRLRRTSPLLRDHSFNDVPGRLAMLLVDFADRFGVREADALRVTHDLTQDELAQLVGATRETVNKAMARFARRGILVLETRSVLILDLERLRRRSG